VISGRPRVGKTLRVSRSVHWLRCDATGARCAKSGPDGRTYRLSGRDAGRRIRAVADRLASAPTPVIRARTGTTTILGTPGADAILGTSGPDIIRGGSGNDRLTGGAGADRLLGGAGRDDLRADDGRRDTVRGGPGRDRAIVDRLDLVVGVERSLRSSR